MRLNETEKRMFDGLRNTDTGKSLARYIERLEGEICDVRNWTKDDSPESARQAATFLTEMRKHLTNSIGKEKVNPDEYH